MRWDRGLWGLGEERRGGKDRVIEEWRIYTVE